MPNSEELEVQSPVGTVIGKVEQQWTCDETFIVKDFRGDPVLSIVGPAIVCDCGSDIEFKVNSLVNDAEVK